MSEMSSISTLEVALENRKSESFWPSWLRTRPPKTPERWFCIQVAQTNKLELLKWAREEKKCEWDSGTINAAAEQGNLEMVKYCVAKKCPIGEWTCGNAAKNGHLEVLKYLREEAEAPWSYNTASGAAKNGHLHILEYLFERNYRYNNAYACMDAAIYGHLDCLKYLHETAKAPWSSWAVRYAHENKHPECLQYLPRQRLSSPRRLVSRRWNVMHIRRIRRRGRGRRRFRRLGRRRILGRRNAARVMKKDTTKHNFSLHKNAF